MEEIEILPKRSKRVTIGKKNRTYWKMRNAQRKLNAKDKQNLEGLKVSNENEQGVSKIQERCDDLEIIGQVEIGNVRIEVIIDYES